MLRMAAGELGLLGNPTMRKALLVTLPYVAALELLYYWYESDPGGWGAMIGGHLLVLLSLPGSLVAINFSLQHHASVWLGVSPTSFAPKLIAFQSGIVLNAALIFLVVFIATRE